MQRVEYKRIPSGSSFGRDNAASARAHILLKQRPSNSLNKRSIRDGASGDLLLRTVAPAFLQDRPAGLRDRAGRGKAAVSRGFTLVEILIVMAIIMTVSAMAVPSLQAAIDDARIAKAVADIREMETEILQYQIINGKLPDTLADIDRDTFLDPWGRPYQYLNFADTKGKGKMRKDRFLVPLNSDYDLYSMGKDGESVPPLTAKVSQDDILRANDGAFIGLASTY
jgi:general secretion pathway protein G